VLSDYESILGLNCSRPHYPLPLFPKQIVARATATMTWEQFDEAWQSYALSKYPPK
jgi:hypothetical protein